VNRSEEIKTTIRNHFPSIFGQLKQADVRPFFEKYNIYIDFMAGLSGAFMTAETVRYQSIMLVSSLFLAIIQLFKPTHANVSTFTIDITPAFLAIYTGYLFALVIIFLTKASLDDERALILRKKNAHVVAELRSLNELASWRRNAELHFWTKIVKSIGSAYYSHRAAEAELMGLDTPIREPDLATSEAVIEGGREADDELKNVIDKLQDFLSDFTSRLSKDERSYKNIGDQLLLEYSNKIAAIPKSDSIENRLGRMQNQLEHDGIRREYAHKLEQAYERYLEKWVEARADLSREVIPTQFFEADLQEAMRKDAKKAINVRRIYLLAEVGLPIIFVICVIAYVWWPLASHSKP
jgi:hypothetical protein